MKKIRPVPFFILLIVTIMAGTLSAGVTFPAKARITLFWRYVPVDMNPLDISSSFKHSGTVSASKSPLGRGGITGKQIISFIKKRSDDKKIVRCRVLSVKAGDNPSYKPTLASVVVREDNSLYDNYVMKTDDDLVIYIDVLVPR